MLDIRPRRRPPKPEEKPAADLIADLLSRSLSERQTVWDALSPTLADIAAKTDLPAIAVEVILGSAPELFQATEYNHKGERIWSRAPGATRP